MKISGPVISKMTVIEVTGLTKDYRVRKKNIGNTSWLKRARNTVSPIMEKLRALNEVNFNVEREGIV